MSKMNMKRVVLGGLLAGLVINIGETILNTVVIGTQMNAELTRLNLPPMGGAVIGVFVALCFLLGIAAIWLYAAIRPRFGAGPKTAVMAAALIWFTGYLFPGVTQVAMGMFPAQLMAIALLWGAVEIAIAAVAGAYVYQETAAPAGRSTATV
jgi:MFS family permease